MAAPALGFFADLIRSSCRAFAWSPRLLERSVPVLTVWFVLLAIAISGCDTRIKRAPFVQDIRSGTLSDRESGRGRLLFKTGFEFETDVVARTDCDLPVGPERSYRIPSGAAVREGVLTGGLSLCAEIVGRDSDAGPEWEEQMLPDLSRDRPGFHISPIPLPALPASYAVHRIDSVVGRDGVPSRALYTELLGDLPPGGFVRSEYALFPPPDLRQAYITYLIRLGAPAVQNSSWRMLMEWKELDSIPGEGRSNYRLGLYLKSNGDSRRWRVKGEQVKGDGPFCTGRCPEWIVDNYAATVPEDQWFRLEVFWRIGDEKTGRLWLAVDGETVADFRGRTTHATDPQPLNFWSIFKLYGSPEATNAGMLRQWIDDVEIWSDFPPGARPCGWL